MIRYLTPYIEQDLKKKMVFLAGPRQVGKTHLSKAMLSSWQGQYFNWDVDEDRQAILAKHWLNDTPLIAFDELHKFPRWKQWIKGVFDSRPSQQTYLVTGSARLDTYKKGGDSLLGRYHYWRLHPLTIDERPQDISPEEMFERLMQVGGFPEPLLQGDLREAKRWRRDRFDRILTEDVRDLLNVRQLQLLRLFVDALRARAGGLIAVDSLARDVEVSSATIRTWLTLVSSLYLAFPIYPMTRGILRSIKKPLKVYFYDNADVSDEPGIRLENLVATHLLKRLQFMEDYNGDTCQLHYVRDKEGREVDFAIVINGVLEELIEVKNADAGVSKPLVYYTEKLKPKRSTQLVAQLKKPYDAEGVRVMRVVDYFTQNVPWET